MRKRQAPRANHYRRGRSAEYRVRDIFIKRGFEVIRSAGSKGRFDLIAIDWTRGEIFFLQVKSGKSATREANSVARQVRLPAESLRVIFQSWGISPRGQFVRTIKGGSNE